MKKNPFSFFYAITLPLFLTAPQVQSNALTTGVPDGITLDSGSRIVGMHSRYGE
jgi:hypothetical protein